MRNEDKKLMKTLQKFARNERRLEKLNEDLKAENKLLKKQPTPEDFAEEFKKIVENTKYDEKYAIKILKHNKERVKGWNDALNQILENMGEKI